MYQAAVSVLGSIGITLIYFYILNIPAVFTRVTKRKLVKPFSFTNYSRSISSCTNATKSTLSFATIARKYTRNSFTCILPMLTRSTTFPIGAVVAGLS